MTLAPCDHRRLLDAGFACDSPRVHLPVVTAATCGRCPWRVENGQPATPAANPPARWRGLGDVVAAAAKLIGLKPRPGCGCDKRREWLNRLVPFAVLILGLYAQLPRICNAADLPPVFEYHQRFATLIVFHEHSCVSVYGLDADDVMRLRFAAFVSDDEPWHGTTLCIQHGSAYEIGGKSYPYVARMWLTADRLILWDRLGSDPLPGTIWGWPHLGIEQPSPDEVLARSPAPDDEPPCAEPSG